MLLGSAQRVLKGEDKFTECNVQIGRDTVFFGVIADGHGGTFAAEHCKRHVVRYISEGADGDSSGAALRRAGSKAFSRLHEEVRASGHTDGTTLTVVMVNLARSELTTLSVGDSAALLVPRPSKLLGTRPNARTSTHMPVTVVVTPLDATKHIKPDAVKTKQSVSTKPQRLTAEHRLSESAQEQKRVVDAGGSVARLRHPKTGMPAGPLRVFPGGLAMARSIGDADAGKVICARPASSTVPLDTLIGFDVVIASDGVWDSLPYTSVLRLCRITAAAPPSRTAELIVESSVSKRHAFNNTGYKVPRDDTTCVLLRFRSASEALAKAPVGCGPAWAACQTDCIVEESLVLETYVCDDVCDDGVAVGVTPATASHLSPLPSPILTPTLTPNRAPRFLHGTSALDKAHDITPRVIENVAVTVDRW